MSQLPRRPERLAKIQPAPGPRKRSRGVPVPTAVRDATKTRAQMLCEVCGCAAGTNWHHRQNRSQGGRNEVANGLWLCGSGTTGCHGWITEHPEESRAAGWSVRRGEDPARRPVRLWHGTVLLTPEGGYEAAPDEMMEAI